MKDKEKAREILKKLHPDRLDIVEGTMHFGELATALEEDHAEKTVESEKKLDEAIKNTKEFLKETD